MRQKGAVYLLCLALALASCGRKGPPLPPEEPPITLEAVPEQEPEEKKEKPPAPQVFDPQQY